MAQVQFVQAQPFKLAGSGASVGDTTILLQSMTGIDGTNIVTADLGTTAYGTLEPGNGTQEEAVSFTGITQNSNGTATLTGVSTVLFKSPYTATSGLAKTHAGASTFILSNDAAFYANILSYVNTSLASGGVPATTTVAGLTKLSVAPLSAPSPIAVGDNDTRLQTNYVLNYAQDTGTANTLVVTLNPVPSALASGTHINFKALNSVTASGATLNVNSLGAKPLRKYLNATLASGDILAGQDVTVMYDGVNFQLVSPTSAPIQRANGVSSKNLADSTTTQTITHNMGMIPGIIKIHAMFSGTAIMSQSYGVYNVPSATYNMIQVAEDASNSSNQNSTSQIAFFTNVGTNNGQQGGTITSVNANTFVITWTKVNSPSGTGQFIWETEAP